MNSLAVTAEQVEQARVLADRARQGDRRAVARCITLIENQHPLSYEVVKHLYPHTGNAYRVGVTGPPGVGKSSLISSLITTCREEDRSIGVISVDPSSPFTQGALRGERICELWEQVGEHAAYLRDHDLLETRRQESLKREVLSLAARRLEHRMVDRASSDPHLADLLGRVQSRDLDPLSAVRLVLRDVFDVPEEDLR